MQCDLNLAQTIFLMTLKQLAQDAQKFFPNQPYDFVKLLRMLSEYSQHDIYQVHL